MTARSRRSPRFALALSLLLALPLLAGMASFGTCAGESYSLTLDVPPRRAPTGIDSITVEDFQPNSWGAAFAQGVRSRLAGEGFVQPVSTGGMAQLRGRVEVGAVRTSQDVETRQYQTEENGRDVIRTYTSHKLRKQLTLSVAYELRIGSEIVARNQLRRSLDQTWEGKTPAEAAANAPSDPDLQRTLLAQLVDEVVRDIAPRRETRDLPLVTGVNPALRDGITHLQNGRPEQAFESWNGVVATSDDPADKAAAYYDIGVVREARGEYADAFESFRNADQLVPANQTYIQAMTRVEQTMLEQRALATPPRASGIAAAAPPAALLRLTVTPDPSWARVRIMNIAPPYQPGMQLSPGSYDVLIDAQGYRPHRQWVDLTADTDLEIRLVPQ